MGAREVVGDLAPPACPRCGVAMVVRERKRRRPNQGERFLGGPSFPRRRGTRELHTIGRVREVLSLPLRIAIEEGNRPVLREIPPA